MCGCCVPAADADGPGVLSPLTVQPERSSLDKPPDSPPPLSMLAAGDAVADTPGEEGENSGDKNIAGCVCVCVKG